MDYDRAYANGPFIPGAETFPPRWAREAAAFRAALGPRARTGVSYGPRPRNALDLFLPDATPQGLLVFVHGGYWLRFDRDLWSHLASRRGGAGMGLRHSVLHTRARSADQRDDPGDRARRRSRGGPRRGSGRCHRPLGGRSSQRAHGLRRSVAVGARQAGRADLAACRSRAHLADRDERRPAPRRSRKLRRRARLCLRCVRASRPTSGSARRNGPLFSGRPDFCPKPGRARGRRKAASITLTSSTVCPIPPRRCCPLV